MDGANDKFSTPHPMLLTERYVVDQYLPAITAGVVIAFLVFTGYVVHRLSRVRRPERVIVAVLVAVTGFFAVVPSIVEAVKQ